MKLQDLRGKKIAFAGKHSTSGYLFPIAHLRENGLGKGAYKTKILKNHQAVAKAVASGRVNAGACFEDCRIFEWPSEKDRNEKTRIIAYTGEIPSDPILVRSNLSDEVKMTLRKAFLLTNAQAALLTLISKNETQITSFIEAEPKMYDQVVLEREKLKTKGRNKSKSKAKP